MVWEGCRLSTLQKCQELHGLAMSVGADLGVDPTAFGDIRRVYAHLHMRMLVLKGKRCALAMNTETPNQWMFFLCAVPFARGPLGASL